MGSPDLDGLFETTESKLAVGENNAGLRIDRAVLAEPPDELYSERLVLQALYHDYDSFRVDAIHAFGTPATFQKLGLLLMSAVLYEKSTLLKVQHKQSGIKEVLVSPSESPDLPGLYLTPTSFLYFTDRVTKHPWYMDRRLQDRRHALPFLELTADPAPVTEEQRAKRDLVRGFGTFEATARLAELLLNLREGRDECVQVALEQEPGFVGVAPGSAELTIWLPGSLAWRNEYSL